MSDHCECCGVKYSGTTIIDPDEDIGKVDPNLKWCSTSSGNGCAGRICVWCASRIPGGIVDVALGFCEEFWGYDHVSVRGYPELAQRIKFLHPRDVEIIDAILLCPRCKKEMIQTESVVPFSGEKEMINKCKACGYC